MKHRFISSVLFLPAGMLFFACSYHKGEIKPAVECTSAATTVSFSADIIPVLTQNCATAGCHSGTSPESNLNLEASKAYASLLKRGSGYVDTINPRSSVIYSSLVSVSSPMPPNGQRPLDACELKLIEMWMKQGAKNN